MNFIQLIQQAVEGFGYFKIGVQVICNVKYADDIVLLAKGIIVVQGLVYRPVEVGRCCGMEMKV
jgi:hypothetical protein